MVWDTTYSFGSNSFVEPAVNAHIWSSHLLCGKFLDISECLRVLLETHSMNSLVNVHGVYSLVTLLMAEKPFFLLATLLCGIRYARPKLETKSMRYCAQGWFLTLTWNLETQETKIPRMVVTN